MRKLLSIAIIAFAVMFGTINVAAQEYQWSVKLPSVVSDETDGNPDAFLWIPDTCTKVRAIIFSQQNMTEETIFSSSRFRKAMSRLGVAIVWIAPYIDQQWNVKTGCQKAFDKMLDDLSEVSGYDLNHTPLIPIGHSAMATFPWNFAAWNPERTLAIISYHGDAPRTNLCGYGRENLEWGRTRNIDGIPGLMIEGEHEWWEARVNPALAFRMTYPGSCVSFLCDAGHGHFDATASVLDYISLFISKALTYRTVKDGKLKGINPADGWLCKRWNSQDKNRPVAAPYYIYKGDRHDAFWYFDGEIANETERIYKASLGKRYQYIGYTVKGKLLNYDRNLHAGTIIDAPLNADGLTFNISAMYTDSTRTTATTAHSKNSIKVTPINGPVIQLNDTTFKIDFYRTGVTNKRRTNEIWLQAIGPGDNAYKAAAQQILVRIPKNITDGKIQTITFHSLDDIRYDGEATSRGSNTIKLSATSSSGLPVNYYVKQGPAIISGNVLTVKSMPPLAKKPAKITVVAWQHGISGSWNTAAPVERDLYCYY